VVAFACGIGVCAAVFSVLNALLFRPLPYPDTDRLVIIAPRDSTGQYVGASNATFLEWRGRVDQLAELSAFSSDAASLTGPEGAERMSVARVGAGFFDVLGVNPLLGRWWNDAEASAAAPVVVIGERLWRRRFNSDPQIVGRPLRLSSKEVTILGVMPETFQFPDDGTLWTPLQEDASTGRLDLRRASLIARLRPGVSVTAFQTAMTAIARQPAGSSPAERGLRAPVTSLRVGLFGESTIRALLLAQGGALLVLLIACANVASLMLARLTVRKDEILVTVALGADRSHVVRALAGECLLVALAGGALGIGLASGILKLLQANWADTLAFFGMDLGLDHRILGFVFVMALLSMLVAGVGPALYMLRRVERGATALGARQGRGMVRRSRLGHLVGIEVAAAAVLLVAAGLFLRTIIRLQAIDPGFQSNNVAVLDANLSNSQTGRYLTPDAKAAYLDQALLRVQQVPGVTKASVTNALPLWGPSPEGQLMITGRPSAGGAPYDLSHWSVVGTDFFAALGIPVVKGRGFTPADRAGAPAVAVVNRTFVKRYFPAADPIGVQIQQPDSAGRSAGWATIVGVVGDVRHRDLAEPTVPEIYYPYGQRPDAMVDFTLVVRTRSAATAYFDPLRKALATVDGDLAFALHTLQQIKGLGAWMQQLLLQLLGAFAGLALGLATIGIFGVASFGVAQRHREMGLRMALGADQRMVLREVMRTGMIPVVAGILAGLLLALGTNRLLSHLLYQTPPTDPLVLVVTAFIILLIGAAACWLPARRAAGTDPMIALRAE
jgi:predicted permease